jgi:hypothetical protein
MFKTFLSNQFNFLPVTLELKQFSRVKMKEKQSIDSKTKNAFLLKLAG